MSKSKVQKIKVDYILVGQGVAGTWLAVEMLRQKNKILIINQDKPDTSSKKAAGIYNPITGRKMVKTWRADDFFPQLEERYGELEKLLKSNFLHPVRVYRPFRTIEDQNDWEGKSADDSYQSYILEMKKQSMGYPKVSDELGGIVLKHSGYVDIPTMLKSARKYFENKGIYRSEVFRYEEMNIEPSSICYQDIEAKKVIFCEGSLSENPYWNLPFRPVRGEIMDIRCDLKSDHIINQGVFMIPKKDRMTIGSTYDHNNLTFEPQPDGIKSLKERLSKLYEGNFEVIEERAGVRPATHDRKPYIGLHGTHKTLGIFNGFGTKGVSLAPYFASHYVEVLNQRCEIDEEVHVERVY